MKTIDIIAELQAALNTKEISILTDLINTLQYVYEEARKKGGNSAVKRQKAIEKQLKENEGEARDNRLINRLAKKCFTTCINDENMQVCLIQFYGVIALNEEHRVNVLEWEETDSEYQNMPNVRFLLPDDLTQWSKIDYDIADIKLSLKTWKAEQKRIEKRYRKSHCDYKLGIKEGYGFNADYLLSIFDVLGPDAGMYQSTGKEMQAYFKSDVGFAILMPAELVG